MRKAPDVTHPPFTVRGRWADARAITWKVDDQKGPLGRKAFVREITRALAVWEGTGLVGFREVERGKSADVVFGWREGRHDRCPEFLSWEGSVAHAGRVEHGTFVHFDRKAKWSADGGGAGSVFLAALHETGHILGLGHSPDPQAIMFESYGGQSQSLQQADLLGLQSLYGGGEDAVGDLMIARPSPNGKDHETVSVLRGVYLKDRTRVDVLDVDGDHRPEIIISRTDEEGLGAMTLYRFSAQLNLVSTVGPTVGITLGASRAIRLTTTSDGRAIMIRQLPDSRYLGHLFSKVSSLPTKAWPEETPLALEDGHEDVDGDGRWEKIPETTGHKSAVRPEWMGALGEWTPVVVQDLNGDGMAEAVLVR